jgi:hypothetical protein
MLFSVSPYTAKILEKGDKKMAKKMKKKAILWKVLGCLVMGAIVMSAVQSLFIFSASAVPIIPSPGVDTDKSNICCGDYITVNVPVKNLKSVSKTVSVYIEIKDPCSIEDFQAL